jgi:hypothetical protein
MASRYGRKTRRQHLARIAELEQNQRVLMRNLEPHTSDLHIAIVVGKAVMLDWKYQLSDNVLKDGMTDAEAIHVAEQVAVKFYERMKAELHGRES